METISQLSTILEAMGVIKRVIRKGEVTEIKVCPEGQMLGDDGKCVRMTQQQKMGFHKRALKAAKSRSHKNQNPAIRSRMKSLKIRKMKSPTLFKERPMTSTLAKADTTD